MYRLHLTTYATLLLTLVLAGAFASEPTTDKSVTATTQARLSSTLPADPPADQPGNPESARRSFNDFAWKEFIALNWPADQDVRGKPEAKASFGDHSSSVVWESWKSVDELFPPDPHATPPTPWESYDAVLGADHLTPDGSLTLHAFPEIPTKDAGRKRLLQHVSRLALTAQATTNANKIGPLVAQNGTYVRYETRINKNAYEFIRNNQYYIRAKLPNDISKGPFDRARRASFPDGSVIVKAAWMELTDKDDKTKFYHIQVTLVDNPKLPVLRTATVGLVGLHIAHRTPTRPSWVWATFEHVDNTEPGSWQRRASFSRNDPTTPNDQGYDHRPDPIPDGAPLPANPKPVDVLKIAPIHPITQAYNINYHKIDVIRNSIWNNYKLVAVQWMPAPDRANPAVDQPTPFPSSYVTNTTIETFRQGESCLSCHDNAADFQFVFFPSKLAYPRLVKKP